MLPSHDVGIYQVVQSISAASFGVHGDSVQAVTDGEELPVLPSSAPLKTCA